MSLSVVYLYASVACVRAANAIFMVSLVLTLPDITPAFHGLILASYALVEALVGVLAGGLYERFGSRTILSLATLALTLLYLTMSLNPTPYLILLLNALAGSMASGVLVASLAVLAEETRGRSVARLFGAGGFEASNLGGYALGFSIALVLELLGILRGFLASAFLSFLAFIASLLTPEFRGRRLLFVVDRRVLKLAPLWFGLANLIGLAFTSPKILVETGISPIIGGIEGGVSLTLITGLLSVSAGLLVGSYIATVVGKLGALILGSASISLALVIGGMFIDVILKPIFLPILVLLAIPAMTLPPAMLALLADYTDTAKARGVQMGFYVTILGLGIASGEFILGGLLFQELGLTPMMIVTAILFITLATPTIYLVHLDSKRGNT